MDRSTPPSRSIPLERGNYHVTLLTSAPSSGILGEDQAIDIWFQALEEFPDLAHHGVPQLVPEDNEEPAAQD